MEQQTMQKMKAMDLPKEVLNLFDKYVHGEIDRRGFLDGASKFAIGGMTAAAMFEFLRPNYALAQQVPANDARVRTEYVTLDSRDGNGKVRCLLARPAARGAVRTTYPGVVVVHENRGLNPYIEDVARRLAVANFIAIAPDGLTSLGGYPGTDEAGAQMQQKLDAQKLLQDFISGARFLREHQETNGKIGAVGFCFGGGMVNQMAVWLPWLQASAPFYGPQPTAEQTVRIQAPLLIHYASMDDRINAGWAAYEKALMSNKKKYTMHMYPNTMHGFHNDTTPRYDAAAAKLAWDRTITFFNENLKST
jgi:carboxymethylenebutenolidase